MSDQVGSLSQQISDLFNELSNGDYLTVRTVAKKLNIKQDEVRKQLPDNLILLPSQQGTLAEARLAVKPEGVLSTGEEVVEVKPAPKKEKVKKVEQESALINADGTQVDVTEEQAQAEDTAQAEAEGVELAVCTVCGNKVRKTTITRRGICPLCFRQLVRNSGQTSKALMELSDDDFEIIVGNELGKRSSLEEYKASRQLTAEQFAEMKDNIIPVKEVFAAAKEAGYGPGCTAQAMGGDRFRHEPLGGFGSVFTPYFVGARKGWYFDKDIVNHFDDMKKPEKVKPEKKERAPRKDSDGNPIDRTGPRGGEMKVVKKKGNPEDTQEVEPVAVGE